MATAVEQVSGQRPARERVAREHLYDVWNASLLLTQDADKARGLARDALVRGCQEASLDEPREAVRVRLFRTMVDLYRSLPSRRGPDACNGEDHAGTSADGNYLVRAVGALPDDLRIPLLLVDVDEFSYADVAAILRLPIGAVRSRVFRARSRLLEVVASLHGEAHFTLPAGGDDAPRCAAD